MRAFGCAVGLVISTVANGHGQPVPARWTVDARPAMTIGENEDDTTATFAVVLGATRLPDGRVLVSDRGSYALRLFTPNGKHERAFGRKGSGPGEIDYLKSMLRCGDSVVTIDISAERVSVFSLDGTFVRAFRFESPQSARSPYHTVCNGRGMFAHFGWEVLSQMRGGAYRPNVPFWLSDADGAVRRVIGSFPGAERYGLVADGRMRGSRPLPLGKHAVIALGADRLYIGSADRYEIQAFDLGGNPATTIRADHAPRAITGDDLEYARELEIAENGERSRAAIERSWATLPLPKTAPAYAELAVDAAGNLWVQDYPRARWPRVTWRVFGRDGSSVAQLDLPTHFMVYEIGSDYILGRYLDPDESIPQVRMYRLRRPTR